MGKLELERKRKISDKKRNAKNRNAKNRGLSKEAAKALRRKKRKQIVIIQMLLFAFLVVGVLFGGGFLIWNMPSIQFQRELRAGMEYTQNKDYDEAVAAYEEAIRIDSTSVKAYESMAGTYLDMEDVPGAKRVLYKGWEHTNDQELLEYYMTILLNEGVEEINSGTYTLSTATKFLTVLEQDNKHTDALELLTTAYEWLNGDLTKQGLTFFYEPSGSESTENLGGFAEYEAFMERLFILTENTKSEQLENLVSQYALWDMKEIKISRQYALSYRRILEKAMLITKDENKKDIFENLIQCFNKEEEIQAIFAPLFIEFDAGNYEAAKPFLLTDTYTGLRDSFIEGTMEYWNGSTYIPVCREFFLLKQGENGWTFEYPEFAENESTAGMISVYGNPMTDEGVQRSCIAYEPAKIGENYFPHTEYVVSYMYSNVQKPNSFEPEMNYHFETRKKTEQGIETVMIGDWGGSYEWKKLY